jgi:rhamnosyltransferase
MSDLGNSKGTFLPQTSQLQVNTCAIIVTYFPSETDLLTLLRELRPQVERIVVVDNGSPDGTRTRLHEACRQYDAHVVLLDLNLGVAAGHNIGIRWAKQNGCSHVALLDQDSVPAEKMISELLTAERLWLAKGIEVGAVGPQFRNLHTGSKFPFIRIEGWRIRRDQGDPNVDGGTVLADYLITSGSLIRVDVFDDVGFFDDDLFIDYVDIEWGLRAKSRGYQNFGVCSVEMLHRLGDPPLPLFRGRMQVPFRSPLRHYYHFRNAIALYRRNYIPWRWSLNDAWRLALKFVVYSVFTNERARHFKMMLLGIFHGFIGKLGPLDLPR